MKVLYVAPCVPYPPNKGEKIRAFHLIRHLAREHAIHVACLADNEDDLAGVAGLAEYCASVDAVYRRRTVSRLLGALALLTGTPFSVASAFSPRLRRRIARKLREEKFDVIVVFSAVMGGYVRHVRSVPKVIDYVDVDSELWRLYVDHHRFPYSWIYRREATRLARHEDDLARAFDHSVFVSEAEAREFGDRAGRRSVSVITNGVDLDYFAPGEDTRSSASPPSVVFTGTMDYFPNVDAVGHFCQRILPLVRATLDVHFSIVGRNPTAPVKEHGRHQVAVTGAVPDVRPYLRGPARSWPRSASPEESRTRSEAMSMRRARRRDVDRSRGMEATDRRRPDRDDPADFASRGARATHRSGVAATMRARRAYTERRHRWADHGAGLASLLRAIAERP
jgi:sugar transferase (PEP-CTERM/EpsH1 system associated)